VLISQVKGMLNSSSVLGPTVPSDGFGDYADFFWVETNHYLEGTRFDPQSGYDWLEYEIGALHAQPTNTHNVGNWLDANQLAPLPSGRFNKDWFNAVDVLSNVARYTDMDVDAGGNWSRRASALDYKVYFADASPIPSWQEGIPITNKLFDDGWTNASTADDFVQRWKAPPAMHAARVRIDHDEVTHDGNVQIDAVIAAKVPNDLPHVLWAL
jgi:hypothetical protein